MLKTLGLFIFNILIFLVIFWLIIFLNTYINFMFIRETDFAFSINMFFRWLIASIEGMAILLILYKLVAGISNKNFYRLTVVFLVLNSIIFLSIYLHEI